MDGARPFVQPTQLIYSNCTAEGLHENCEGRVALMLVLLALFATV